MAAPTTPTNNRLLVTKPTEMDRNTERGFRETERFVNSHPGIPAGGSSGQVLEKNSATNYDVSWQTPSGGGGGAIQPMSGGGVRMGTAAPVTMPILASQYLVPLADTNDWDSGGVIDRPNNRLVVPSPGIYIVSASVYMTNLSNTADNGRYNLEVRQYDTGHVAYARDGYTTVSLDGLTSHNAVTHTKVVNAQVGDYFQMLAMREQGGINTDTAYALLFSISQVSQWP